jgi:hypothetical protein
LVALFMAFFFARDCSCVILIDSLQQSRVFLDFFTHGPACEPVSLAFYWKRRGWM